MPSTKHQRADLFLGGIDGFKEVTSGDYQKYYDEMYGDERHGRTL